MKLTELSLCSKVLHFMPRRNWPKALPLFSWNGILLNGFERTDQATVVDLGENATLLEAFVSIYEKLNLMELARLFRAVRTSVELEQLNWTELVENYGLRDSEAHREILHRLLDVPEAMQKWVEEKDLSVRDLMILLSFDSLKSLQPCFQFLSEKSCSKSEGVKILELYGELVLLDRDAATALSLATSAGEALRSLEFLRYPMRKSMQNNLEEKLKSVEMPVRTQARFLTQGDETSLELKLQAKNPEDLKKRLESLQKLETSWWIN